jgi:hypothetical protein
MDDKKEGFQFARVASILLLFACLGLVGGGLVRIFKDGAGNLIGWAMLGGGFLVTFATVNQWGRILPGVFGLAGINALVTLWSGHQINRPDMPVPRAVAVVLAVVFFSAAFLSGSIAVREFNVAHKLLLFAVFVLLLIAMIANQFAIPGAIGAVACLFVLWRLPAPNHRYRPQSHP